MKGKTSEKSPAAGKFAKGGSTKMFGKQAAGPQTPGLSAKKNAGDGGKFAKGGGKKMFGQQSANPSKVK